MQAFDIATQSLLLPSGLNNDALLTIMGKLLAKNIDHADLYFQSVYQENWFLEDSRVKEASYNIDQGVGVRAVSGEKTGLAYSNDIVLSALENAASAAKSIATSGQNNTVSFNKQNKIIQPHELYLPLNPITTLPDAQKISLLHQIDQEARALSPHITQVMASLAGVYEVVLIMNNQGEMVADIRPLVRINVTVIAEQGNRREQGVSGGGGRFGYQTFLENHSASHHVKEAVRQALINLDAKPAPAGMMPVVLGPGWPGVLLHEAIGHGLEGDFNRKGTSAFSGRLGQTVAAKNITVVDDGTLHNRRGSLNIDDEGTPTSCTTLIENGVLKNYMQDKLNAKLMGMQPTGNGRRESYASMPMPRMTNTYMLPGEHTPEEIIASVKKGIYAVNFGGGQVDITSGKFVFSASEAYLIENGKVTSPIKGATLIGNGPDVLTKVSMVGNDLKLDEGVGTCGKDGQSVPVGVGQPTLKIEAMTVGGTG
ncbi:MAG TPA: metalloprotease TldD [Gammaproteobacteria bacterium]|nr:metalloprotease TldD [Gammaproteobacteria bacterium]